MEPRTYLAIDLKSFYASVECVERGLDPMTTNLVVADASRSEKTICLAVSPSLKAYGIPGRARLFEVVQKVRQINAERKAAAPNHQLGPGSVQAPQLQADPTRTVEYIIAPPRMAYYMKHSTRIYQIYLKYVAPEDIHVYSIDEVLMDVTSYLHTYQISPQELAMRMILDVLHTTGITATAGIGTNLYLCKIALDIGSKHIAPDKNGVRIAELDEERYRKMLWSHRPLTDFWRVGKGYAKKLEEQGLYTMGDIARCSVGDAADYYNEELLYRMFGVNAELLIDHAWGWEPCTMADIKAYKPSSNSIGSGQVLQEPYSCEKARLVVREMADLLALELVDQGLQTNHMTLTIGYDRENLLDPNRKAAYHGPISMDPYGRAIPKQAHGSISLTGYTSSTKQILQAVTQLFDRIADSQLLVRRLNLTADRVLLENDLPSDPEFEQIDLFTDYEARSKQQQIQKADRQKEKRMQQTILEIKKKFGKNSILKGMDLEQGATAQERNRQIGGHKA